MRSTVTLVTFAALLLAGCASPGSPAPPSLNLPQPVKNLRAERRGDTVHLNWTVPERTTDGLLLTGASPRSRFSTHASSHSGALAAEICRMESSVCKPLARLTVKPDEEAGYVDRLPESLRSGAPSLLEYHVVILNANGRSAGKSNAAQTATGEVPPAMAGLKIRAVRQGMELQWTPDTHPHSGDVVEIRRETILKSDGNPSRTALLHVAGVPDPAGTVDQDTHPDEQYRYTVSRLRVLPMSSQRILLYGAEADVVTQGLSTDLPPAVPQGLVAAATPGLPSGAPAIDLSWEPNQEAGLAGYVVYRSDSTQPDTWTRISAETVTTPSFHDTQVSVGHSYHYRVTAVSPSGKQSLPSRTARESLRGVE